jgi:hypothetical protein
LPDNAGTGLTAFYIALLLLLGGFTGSMVINSVVDGSLGFVPTEIGPIYQLRKRPDLPTAKAVTDFPVGNADGQVGHHVRRRPDPFLGVPPGGLAAGCGPAEYGPALAVRRFPIAAVDITAISIMAVLGGFGLLINLVLFDGAAGRQDHPGSVVQREGRWGRVVWQNGPLVG